MNYKQLYEKVLKNICEKKLNRKGVIIEVERPDFSVDLIPNKNANYDSFFALKLDEGATEEDYKKFIEYVGAMANKDMNEILNEEFDPDNEEEDYNV